MKLFLIIFTTGIFLLSCHKRNNLKQIITKDFKKVLYSFYTQKYPDSNLTQLFSKDISVGLELPFIEHSSAEKELRIYYFGPFEHRFFRQQIIRKDSLVLELYMCGMERNKDSSFLLSKDHIVISGKCYGNIVYPGTDFPGNIIVHEKGDVLDNAAFFIEVKSGDKIKQSYVENRSIENYGEDEKIIHSLLNEVEEKYTFKFQQDFDKITATFASRLLN